jgi:hypothetical protein
MSNSQSREIKRITGPPPPPDSLAENLDLEPIGRYKIEKGRKRTGLFPSLPPWIYGGPFGPPIQQRPQPLGYLPLLVG